MFNYFEKKLYPYPDIEETVPPKGFLAFVWEATSGVRRYLVAMTLLTAAIGAFEALFFAILGKIVDWLSHIPPALLWEQERVDAASVCRVIGGKPGIGGIAEPCSSTRCWAAIFRCG